MLPQHPAFIAMEVATKQTPLLYLKPMPQYAHGKRIIRFHCVIGEVRLGYSTSTGSYNLFSLGENSMTFQKQMKVNQTSVLQGLDKRQILTSLQ